MAHNSSQLNRSVNIRRGSGFLKVLVDIMSKYLSTIGAVVESPAAELASSEPGV